MTVDAKLVDHICDYYQENLLYLFKSFHLESERRVKEIFKWKICTTYPTISNYADNIYRE